MLKRQGTKGFTEDAAGLGAALWCAFVAAFVSLGAARAQDAPPGADFGAEVFFDAKQSGFTKDGTKKVLEGDVVAIGGGALIAADRVLLDSATGLLEAEGHIVVLSRSQLFVGDMLAYHLATGDFRMTNALMVSNDQAQIEAVTRRLFGFTPKEVAFESARKQRLAEVRARKQRLQAEARRQTRQGAAMSDDLVDRYAVLLEQEQQIVDQENPALASLAEERRNAFKERRRYWEASRKSALRVESKALAKAYFHLEGDEITRVQGNDYEARNALFTPCFCEEGESPAWAFRADRVEAQIGGYADLHHPVLEIKGIPVLYLPYLKVPLKDRRQSGFLLPTIGFEKRSGNTFTQPVYFDLGQNADATFVMDVYENRGTRLGLEYRIQQREHSGWELKLEGIRDRLWMRDRAIREDMGELYREGLAYAAGVARDPTSAQPAVGTLSGRDVTRRDLRTLDYWGLEAGMSEEQVDEIVQTQEREIDRYMLAPENTWRGAYGWRGLTFFAPRLSLVSNGEITSDHRYSEELYIPDDYADAFFGSRDARAFSTAKAQVNLDGRDYYVGVGTYFGDNFQLEERFQGQQLPLRLKVLSRTLSLLPERSVVPLYATVQGEQLRITQYRAESSQIQGQEDQVSLGDGTWRRLKVDFVAPLVSERIVQVNQFTELESRYIEHASLDGSRSEIRSWRTGIELRLPIDGTSELPAAWQDGVDEMGEESPRKHLHHIMDWRLRFSARPSVVKNGPYTTNLSHPDDPRRGEAYFASDVGAIPGESLDVSVPDEERMARHRRVTLVTDQVWKLFRRGWSRVPTKVGGKKAAGPDEPAGGTEDEGEGEADVPTQSPEDVAERARRELLTDRPISGVQDLYDEAEGRWLIDRYQLQDKYYEAPVSLHADIAYDFLDAEQRPRDRAMHQELAAAAAEAEARYQSTGSSSDEDARDKAVARRDALAPAEPWKDLNVVLGVNYANWRLRAATSYGIYVRTARSMGLSLAPPRFFATNVSLAYTLEKQHSPSGAPPAILRERTLGLATSLIPKVITDIRVSRQTRDERVSSYRTDYRVATGVTYNSPSKCWGLQFARVKDYAQDEANAEYLLRLNVVFMGEQRALPDMSPGLRRQMGEDPELEGAG